MNTKAKRGALGLAAVALGAVLFTSAQAASGADTAYRDDMARCNSGRSGKMPRRAAGKPARPCRRRGGRPARRQ